MGERDPAGTEGEFQVTVSACKAARRAQVLTRDREEIIGGIGGGEGAQYEERTGGVRSEIPTCRSSRGACDYTRED